MGATARRRPELSPGSISYYVALTVTPDGKLLAAGAADLSQAGPSDSFIVRYKKKRRVLDRSFGRRGKVTTRFEGGGLSEALLRQRDGKIVVAGSGPDSFALARFNANVDSWKVDRGLHFRVRSVLARMPLLR